MCAHCVEGYVINNEVVFIAEQNVLHSIRTGEALTIKKTASLCLLLLLQKHNTIVTQNELLAFAWGEEHRLVSFNAFYQSILSLRKSFSLLGVSKQVITTIPRKGLIVYDNIAVRLSDANSMPERVGSDHAAPLETPVITPHINEVLRARGMFITFYDAHKIYLILVFVAILSSVVFLLVWHHSEHYFSGYQYAGKLDNKCQYFFNTDSRGHDRHAQFLANFPEYCPPNKYAYITAHEDAKNISVFICSLPANVSQKNTCLSVYYPEFPEK